MEHFPFPWFHKGKKVKVVNVGDVVERLQKEKLCINN